MPSPNSSPLQGGVSPSALRARHLLSPTTVTDQGSVQVQWTIRNNNDHTILQSADEIDDVDEQLAMAVDDLIDGRRVHPPGSLGSGRRGLMNAMRSLNDNGRRRTSRPTSANVSGSGNGNGNGNGAIHSEQLMFNSIVMQLAGQPGVGASGFEAIANNINNQSRVTAAATTSGMRQPSLRNKMVYILRCTHCSHRVCNRAMKAILLADTKIELYSTDIPPERLALLEEDRLTQGCHCRIRDTACMSCGNVLGYHVSQPCERCLDAKNNGHFWMFYSETIRAEERLDEKTGKTMCWGSLSPMRELEDHFCSAERRYEMFCR